MIWCCPRCHATLRADGTQVWLTCVGCEAAYEVFCGIPDLRIGQVAWINLEEDRAIARELEARAGDLSTKELVREVFLRRGPNEAWVNRRTRQVLGAVPRLAGELRDWLETCTAPGQLFLDLGCGPGMLLAAAGADGRSGIGIDVSLVWLIVAQRLIRDYGGTPDLAAAFAESLPLADCVVSGVVALDVIEHVVDQPAMLREIDRVTKVGGRLALATPNRFSLGPEPHVSVWGVGWLPRQHQDRYVRWRTGHPYGLVLSLSTRAAARLLRENTSLGLRSRTSHRARRAWLASIIR